MVQIKKTFHFNYAQYKLDQGDKTEKAAVIPAQVGILKLNTLRLTFSF